jgi:hypothetical protein
MTASQFESSQFESNRAESVEAESRNGMPEEESSGNAPASASSSSLLPRMARRGAPVRLAASTGTALVRPGSGGTFKTSGHYIDQKLKHQYDVMERGAPSLFDLLESDELKQKVSETKGHDLQHGIRMTPEKEKIINCLMKLLNTKSVNYQGNLPAREGNYGGMRTPFPMLKFNIAELACEYTGKENSHQLSGKEISIVREMLENLANERHLIVYRRTRWEEGKHGKREEKVDRIEEYRPLIRLMKYLEGLTPDEEKRIAAGDIQLAEKKGQIVIQINPLLVDQIDTKFVEYPADINQRTALAAGGPKKVTTSIIRLRDYLMRAISANRGEGELVESISAAKMPYILGLEKYIAESRKKLVEQRVNEAIGTVEQMGLVKEVRERGGASGQKVYDFVVNRDFR